MNTGANSLQNRSIRRIDAFKSDGRKKIPVSQWIKRGLRTGGYIPCLGIWRLSAMITACRDRNLTRR
jgi:hypothetical protein